MRDSTESNRNAGVSGISLCSLLGSVYSYTGASPEPIMIINMPSSKPEVDERAGRYTSVRCTWRKLPYLFFRDYLGILPHVVYGDTSYENYYLDMVCCHGMEIKQW
jgi:hypothetical protein